MAAVYLVYLNVMLQKFVIEGLRGFNLPCEIRSAQPNGSLGSGLTLLTGPNNSGKSTIIEALKVRAAHHQTPSFHVGMRNARTDYVSITYQLDGAIETLKSARAGSSETIADRKSNMAPYIVPSRRQFSPNFGRSGPLARGSFVLQAGSHQAFREQTLSNFEGRLFELERNHIEFDKLLQEVLPGFMSWSIDQNEAGQYFIKLKSDGKSHSLAGSGDGIISVFVIVAALFDSAPADVIAIDEPELSLHPTVQRRLSSIISRFASDRQIFVSTHSPYFIDPHALANGAEIVRTWDRGGTIELFQLSIASCGELKRLISFNANNPHVFGLDAREIFFADDPILVFEGQEDVVFWPKAAAVEPRLAAISTYGWGAGGAANMSNVLSVLTALGFRKIAGVLDNNRPDDFAKLRRDFPNARFIELPAPDIRTKPAVKAREEVVGLLDASGSVRPEHAAIFGQRLSELADFLAG